MKSLHARAVLCILATSVPIALMVGCGQGEKHASAADELASLEVGQWIRIEGTVRADSTAVCDEIRLLTGDFLDDDWALKGNVETMDAAKTEFVIGGVRIQVTESTGFDSEDKTFSGFSDLHLGQLVEVEGTYLKNRRFLAMDVDDESDEVDRTPWSRNRVLLVGKVEQVDPRKRLVSAMGFAFRVTERTRLRSAVK